MTDNRSDNSGLSNPAEAQEQAPEQFKVLFETTKGPFTLEVNRDWAPLGADRFYNLVQAGYFENIAFFRVLDGFVAQFGIHGDPEISRVWRSANIADDSVKESNRRGYISYAMAGPNTRTTQLFINLVNNPRLDGMNFAPFGRIVEGMDVVDSLHSGYGEGAPHGRGPSQPHIQQQGNDYLKRDFPELDYILSAEIKG
jgi:peptidyl-prolyl cis-trans isomerase A (cyclophilin A)